MSEIHGSEIPLGALIVNNYDTEAGGELGIVYDTGIFGIWNHTDGCHDLFEHEWGGMILHSEIAPEGTPRYDELWAFYVAAQLGHTNVEVLRAKQPD